jgi:predicted RNA-binding Zn ribbon-like protein
MVNTELVQDFVNSRELRPAVEDLGTPEQLAAWLAERELLEPGARLTNADLAEVVRVREALRDLLSAKVGIDVDVDAAKAEIDAAARRAGLEVRFDPTCPRVEPTESGVRAAVGRILVEVYDEMVDGIWERMKACKADDCRWAFLDTSKNKSRAWCSMESCGNRAKGQRVPTASPAVPGAPAPLGTKSAHSRHRHVRRSHVSLSETTTKEGKRAQGFCTDRAHGRARACRCRGSRHRASGHVRPDL